MKKFSSFNSLFVAIFAAVTLSTFLSQKAEAQYNIERNKGSYSVRVQKLKHPETGAVLEYDNRAPSLIGVSSTHDMSNLSKMAEFKYQVNDAIRVTGAAGAQITYVQTNIRQFAVMANNPPLEAYQPPLDQWTPGDINLSFHSNRHDNDGFEHATAQATSFFQFAYNTYVTRVEAHEDSTGVTIKVFYKPLPVSRQH